MDLVSALPKTIRELLAEIIRSEFPGLQRPAGPHRYRVAAVRADGRVDLVPVATGALQALPNVDHWAGVAGGSALPMVGSVVLVAFADGDPTAPVLVSYQPLRSAGGKPTRTTIDAATLQLGPTATVVELGGGAQFVALANLVSAELTKLSTTVGAMTALFNAAVGPMASAPASVIPYVQGSVAATKTRAT